MMQQEKFTAAPFLLTFSPKSLFIIWRHTLVIINFILSRILQKAINA